MACALLITGAAVAQNALDNNLSTSGKTNYARPKPAVSKDIYTLNRATGEFRYNRANAFNDSTYSIYQRHTSDRFDAAHAAGVSTAANAYRPSGRTSPSYASPSASTDRRNSAFGTPTEMRAGPERHDRTRPSSGSHRYDPGSTLAPAYHPATYSGADRDLPSDAPPVTLSDRRDEWAPPITERQSAPVGRRGYSVVDDSIWPWR